MRTSRDYSFRITFATFLLTKRNSFSTYVISVTTFHRWKWILLQKHVPFINLLRYWILVTNGFHFVLNANTVLKNILEIVIRIRVISIVPTYLELINNEQQGALLFVFYLFLCAWNSIMRPATGTRAWCTNNKQKSHFQNVSYTKRVKFNFEFLARHLVRTYTILKYHCRWIR